MKRSSRLAVLALLLVSSLASCSFYSTATRWNGRVGPDGEPCSLTPACVDGHQPKTGPDAAVGSPVAVFPEWPESAAATIPSDLR